jgi:hypothetical protein
LNNHFSNYISLGFAGKRAHDQLPKINKPLRELFNQLTDKLQDCHIHFTSGLADGADQIASSIFLDASKHKNRSLGAIMAFSREDYLKTITDQAAFEDLYKQCTQILHLDGNYIEGQPGDELRDQAYHQQGQVLGRICDVFIAVAPRTDDPGKKGSTISSLLAVLSLHKPVIFLNLEDHQFYLYQNLDEWMQNEKLPVSAAEIVSKLFPDHVIGQKPVLDKTESVVFFSLRKLALKAYDRWSGKRSKPASKPEDTGKTSLPIDESNNHLFKSIRSSQKKLDDIAQYFQLQYRGGYILNYFLALIAIFLAVFSAVILMEKESFKAESVHFALVCMGSIKILIILAMVYNTKQIRKKEYNKKAIDYRYAAERFRVNYFMSLIGIVRAPRPFLGNHSKNYFQAYRGEMIYQSKMSEALKHSSNITLDKTRLTHVMDFILHDWLENQLSYHTNEQVRMTSVDKRLLKIPEKLNTLVLGIVIAEVLGAFLIEMLDLFQSSRPKEIFGIAGPILLALTAFIPAIVTTLNSIHFQTEAHRLATRSSLMIAELKFQISKVKQVIKDHKKNKKGCSFLCVLDAVEETANVMTDEVAEWSLIYEKRVFDP